MIIPIGNPRWQPSWKSIFCFFYCTEMPVDSKVGRRHWGWLILLVTFWKFQHFNLVSKIFQKLFKPLPCHKSIGKMLHAICISAVAVSLRWASCGPWASCFFFVFFCFFFSTENWWAFSYFSMNTCVMILIRGKPTTYVFVEKQLNYYVDAFLIWIYDSFLYPRLKNGTYYVTGYGVRPFVNFFVSG